LLEEALIAKTPMYLVQLPNCVVPFRWFVTQLSLLQVFADLHSLLDMCADDRWIYNMMVKVI